MNKEAQLTLPFPVSEESLKDRLGKMIGKHISLAITDNSTSMISARKQVGVLHVRLHRMFLSADAGVIDEIAAFIRRKKSRTPLISAFIRKNSGIIKKAGPGKRPLHPKGRYHDLSGLAESVNREYFSGKITAAITWGNKGRRRAVRRRTLGSYSRHTDTIRINPILDKRTVPSCFVEFILYHEMLHADIASEVKGGRRAVHTPEFRRRERMFKKYSDALAWEEDVYIM